MRNVVKEGNKDVRNRLGQGLQARMCEDFPRQAGNHFKEMSCVIHFSCTLMEGELACGEILLVLCHHLLIYSHFFSLNNERHHPPVLKQYKAYF